MRSKMCVSVCVWGEGGDVVQWMKKVYFHPFLSLHTRLQDQFWYSAKSDESLRLPFFSNPQNAYPAG